MRNIYTIKGSHEWGKNNIVSGNVYLRIGQNFPRVTQCLDAYFWLNVKNLTKLVKI